MQVLIMTSLSGTYMYYHVYTKLNDLDRYLDCNLDRNLDHDQEDTPVYTFIVQYDKEHHIVVHYSVII